VSEEQLDLFSGSGITAGISATKREPGVRATAELDDATLLEAIPASGRAEGPLLAAEAGRRRLDAAIPVLEDYCRRFAGFGVHRAVPEQIAALEALASIGGKAAAGSVARTIASHWVQGPTMATAVSVAAQLGSLLPADTVLGLLRHTDRAVRGDACRLARPGPGVRETLIDLLGDLDRGVCVEAACALGRMGWPEALPALRLALRHAPSARVIESAPPVADDECVVLLGRIASGPDAGLAAAAAAALEVVEHPLATRLLARLRNE
jgi:HEAT repeats